MKTMKIVGIIALLSGIILFLVAGYISGQIAEGQGKISKGQTQVNQLREASSWNPYTKDVGGVFADSGQRKINAGKEEVVKYQKVVSGLRIGGTAAVILGGVLLIIGFLPRK